MQPLFTMQNVQMVAAKSTILDFSELSVNRGEVFVILGPNGSGKSTLLRMAAGLEKPTRGIIRMVDSPSLSELEYRRQIATVFQSPLLLSDTVENNISAGLKFRNLPAADVKQRTAEWMARLHIEHLAKRRAHSLSGGEAQRVSLARAFCLETPLILMDEPFSALDGPTRHQLIYDLRAILSETNQTCLFVTHDLEEALAIGDKVAVFFNGYLHQAGTLQEVFTQPATPETAAFVGVDTIFAGQVIENNEDHLSIQANGFCVEAVGTASAGTSVYVCLRPEDITLSDAASTGPSSTARNHIPCKIVRLINQGPFVKVFLDAGFPLTALITRTSAAEMNLIAGKNMLAVFKATAIHLIEHGKITLK